MYVVRLILPDGKVDFKAFERRPDAVKRFEVGSYMVWGDDLKSAALFEVPDASNARTAVQAAKTGEADRIILLNTDTKDTVKKAVKSLIEEWIIEGKLPPLIPTSDHA